MRLILRLGSVTFAMLFAGNVVGSTLLVCFQDNLVDPVLGSGERLCHW